MTVLALPHPSAFRASRTRFGRTRASSIPAVPDVTETKVSQIRELVDRGAYTVDANQVADAIVVRLIAGRSVPKPS